MRSRPPVGPSRRLIALLLAVTILPLVSLAWLGRNLLDADRHAAVEQADLGLARAADLVTAGLQRAVAEDDRRAAAGAHDWPEGAVVVTFTRDRVEATPHDRIAYYPAVPRIAEAPAALFDAVDRAEFQLKDQHGAIALLEGLTASPDPLVRPTARLRMARMLAAIGDTERALEFTTPLLDVDTVAFAGSPISLVARYQRCQLLAALSRRDALRQEASAFERDLITSRWRLTGPIYALYQTDAERWLDGPPKARLAGERLAAAVLALWEQRATLPSGRTAAPVRRTLTVGGEDFSVLWQPRVAETRVLVVTPEYVRDQWLARAGAIDLEPQVDVRIEDRGAAQADGAMAGGIVRGASDTGLPWDVTIARSAAAGPVPPGTSRRQLLIMGLAVLISMALASSYFVARAVHREVAVARMQSDFVATVSHEFRTPLTTLRQFTDMLREGAGVDEERRQLCYDAQSRATERLTHLVESVLDLGRMEAGQHPYQFEPVRCAQIVRAVVDDFQREVLASGYTIHLRADDGIEVLADAEALGRALRNLLENAVKYSPGEHSVEVDLTSDEAGVRIAVRDHGIGVAPGERRAIFDRFQRGSDAKSRGIAGTGIGLAMVDHIVRAHRGHVDLASEPGRGSTFTIVLPVADRSVAGYEEPDRSGLARLW